MRIAASLALLTMLAAPMALPAPAEAQDTIRRAVEREAARLAEAPERSSLRSVSAERQAETQLSSWLRVATLEPADEILLTTARVSRLKRRLLDVSESGLTILNLDDPAVPSQVKDVLARTGRFHPGYFAAAQQGRPFVLSRAVRIGPDGVFQHDRKLFDVGHVIEFVPRDDVVEISVIAKHVWQHARRGMLIGAVTGAVVLGIGAANCANDSEPGYCSVPGMSLLGAIGGGAIGLEYGAIVGAIVPKSPDLIYRR